MTEDTRFKILTAMINARKPLTLSSLAKRLKMVPQQISYHLIALEDEGLIIRDGYEYFPQPLLIDEELHTICAERLSEVITAFSAQDGTIVVQDGQDANTVILNVLRALIQTVLPKEI